MTALRYRGCRPAAFAVTGAAALLMTGISAVPASAHTPSWSVDCSTVSVDLTAYSAEVTNTVTIEADGKKLYLQKFGRELHEKFELPAHSEELTVRVIIEAGDDDRFSRDETKTSPVCDGPEEPAPSPSTSAPGTPEPAPSSSEPDVPSEEPESSAPPAGGGGSSSDLAETGGSDATPVIAGGAGVVLAAGAGLLFAARRRRSAQR